LLDPLHPYEALLSFAAELLGPDEDLTNVKVEDDEAGVELHLALNKTRKLKQKKDLTAPEKVPYFLTLFVTL
jgi:hypothetical protein